MAAFGASVSAAEQAKVSALIVDTYMERKLILYWKLERSVPAAAKISRLVQPFLCVQIYDWA